MNADQSANIEATILAIGDSMFSAWSYLQLLKGLHLVAKSDPDNLQAYALAIDVMYRAVFDALYSAVGTICDRTNGVLSLPHLIKKARQYGDSNDAGLKRVLSTVQAELSEPNNAPLVKLENWRNKHVAHRTNEGRVKEFHLDNRLSLAEVEGAIASLEGMVNAVSTETTKKCYDWRSAAEPVSSNFASLLTCAVAT